MSGLNLMGNGRLSTGAWGGSMSQGGIPVAAGVSAGGPTISQAAFGVYSQQTGAGTGWAGFGSVALAAIGAGVLIYLWYSLPR